MDFVTEIRKVFDTKYIKVFLSNSENIGFIKSVLEHIPSIHKVNITKSQSAENDSLTLTVYPKKMFSVEIVNNDIQKCLSSLNYENLVLEQSELDTVTSTLVDCPEAKKLFYQALGKHQKKGYERNALDDMRLCLELFLKKKFGNNLSLENQIKYIGKYQKEKGWSTESSNMFHCLLDYYSKFQNEHVKHNDNVNENEADFIIKLTINFINSL